MKEFNKIDEIVSNLDFNILADRDLLKFERFTLVQISGKNSKSFIEFYLSNYERAHSRLGQYTATDATLSDIYTDDDMYKYSSIYLMLKYEEKLLGTLKATKRQAIPLRTENKFGFDILGYLGVESYDALSVWHHSKTSVNKDLNWHSKNFTIRDLLKIMYYVLYLNIYNDGGQLLLGEVNDLNYKSMKSNGINMAIVTPPLKTLGLPAYGIAINREDVLKFLKSEEMRLVLKNIKNYGY